MPQLFPENVTGKLGMITWHMQIKIGEDCDVLVPQNSIYKEVLKHKN